jgi:phosphatidylserine/phosphatidylglycerophosphate/cardiolipin synthase-like enzyme
VIPVLLLACAAPDPAGLTSTLAVDAIDDPAAANARFVDQIDAAEHTLAVGLPAGDDTTLSDALIAAQGRGVAVEVVTDVDVAASPAIAALLDAEVPVKLADGGITYFDFDSSADVGWSSDQVMMTEAYAIADGTYFTAATTAGGLATGTRIVFSGHDEDLGQDLSTEHNQLFGGTDATALDAYAAPSKSIADWRWKYGTSSDADLEVWLGPQERVGKRFTDAVYGARFSVKLLTDDFSNDGLVRALQAKADEGLDVQVVVGPHFGESSSILARELTDADLDVLKVSSLDDAPSILIIDADDSDEALRRALVATLDLYSPPRFYRGAPVTTDQLVDSQLWVIDDWGATSQLIAPLQATFDAYRALGEAP